jgi:hypothetical protein
VSGLADRIEAARREAERDEREGRAARLGADKQALSERATAILGAHYRPEQVGDDGLLRCEDGLVFRLPPQGTSGLTLLEEGGGDFTFHALSELAAHLDQREREAKAKPKPAPTRARLTRGG